MTVSFLYVLRGDWDLEPSLPIELQFHQKTPPRYFEEYIKEAFRRMKGLKKRPKGMPHMQNMMSLELMERSHSGIDGCRSIARICQAMLPAKSGSPSSLHGNPKLPHALITCAMGNEEEGTLLILAPTPEHCRRVSLQLHCCYLISPPSSILFIR